MANQIKIEHLVYDPKDQVYGDKVFNCWEFFHQIYNKVPSLIILKNDSKSYFSYNHIMSILKSDYKYDDNDTYTVEKFDEKSSDKTAIEEQICDLKNGIVLQLTMGDNMNDLLTLNDGIAVESDSEKSISKVISKIFIYFLRSKNDETKALANKINQVLLSNGKGINIICKGDCSFYSSSAIVREPKIPSLRLNYGEKFEEIHHKITDWLNDDQSEGIILLHGLPGTGKTSYIRYLINKISGKDFIYLPPNLAEKISEPNFLPYLMENKNSILIIEDAENIIKDRQDPTVKTQAVANLLNISDGLLGDSLHQKIIATFNCDLSAIDSALLRKGRLITQYHFDKLNIEDSQKLADHLKIKTKIEEPKTLAEIYNI